MPMSPPRSRAARSAAASAPTAGSPPNAADELRRLRALHEAALQIAAPVSSEPAAVAALLSRVVDRAVAAIGGRDGLLILTDDPVWRQLVPDREGEGLLALRSGGEIHRQPVRPSGATHHVLRTGLTTIVPDTRVSTRFGGHADLAARGIHALALVPLKAGDRVLGAISIGFDRPGGLAEADQEALQLFGAHAAAALERVRLMHVERARTEELARRDAETTALRELDRLKDQFIAMISHELRTPLSLVFGYAELMHNNLRTLDPATVELMAGKIRIGAEQLARLVDDLLDFARIERGEVVVRPEDFDLAPTLRELALTMRGHPGAEQLVCDLPGQLPVRADRARVSQIVAHLLGNAIKYAPGKSIVLRASEVDASIRVEVEDRGPGITPDEQPRVWDKFYRGSAFAEKNVARGAGLGLAIVKTMIEAQDGRVGLESAPGQGARFWFELPTPSPIQPVPTEVSAR
jgi:signal transduction histidine kinase